MPTVVVICPLLDHLMAKTREVLNVRGLHDEDDLGNAMWMAIESLLVSEAVAVAALEELRRCSIPWDTSNAAADGVWANFTEFATSVLYWALDLAIKQDADFMAYLRSRMAT